MRIEGLIAAAFSPMHADGSLNLSQVPAVVEHLMGDGIAGLYVCGTTGEGPLLSSQERRATAEAYVAAAANRIPVIVQVGHDSLAESKDLARHAQDIGAQAISAIAPRYFGCDSLDTLMACLSELCAHVPDLPFFYYHIPGLSGVNLNMMRLLERAADQLPAFAGIKYSATNVHEFQACLDWAGERYSILFGCD